MNVSVPIGKESVLRTLVPIIYALLLESGGPAWLGLEDGVVQSTAALLGAGLIYVALRFLERRRAIWGWLLGYPSAPVYLPDEDLRAMRGEALPPH